ncbi:hypothetical protein OOK31_19895 [Streptomyces sp. NBC_00249]|uniref:hypothetical protein n=1 Tax=Streptomyces sp. NBC_00249 TaxID=2975690 RepID=UPI00225B1B25|nr:hypothetical protein [Streptomyces sp. NBC_00249]MCX5196131.1 hypothetical protein [Streptomyces sp. NBC_00249]
MPIDPYAALNAMLRAEAARFTPPARRAEPAPPQPVPVPADTEPTGEVTQGPGDPVA